MQNKTKFAIGDRVRVIESEDTDTQTRTFIGKTVIVTDTANNGKHVICKAEKIIVVFNDSELELISSVKTLENLEVGDVVIREEAMRTSTQANWGRCCLLLLR